MECQQHFFKLYPEKMLLCQFEAGRRRTSLAKWVSPFYGCLGRLIRMILEFKFYHFKCLSDFSSLSVHGRGGILRVGRSLFRVRVCHFLFHIANSSCGIASAAARLGPCTPWRLRGSLTRSQGHLAPCPGPSATVPRPVTRRA